MLTVEVALIGVVGVVIVEMLVVSMIDVIGGGHNFSGASLSCSSV